MKQEHKYAQALRWIAGGEHVQIRWGKHPHWMELLERNEIVMGEILRGAEDYEFRIKPRAVKIGNREIAAPLPVNAHPYTEGFTTDNYGNPHHWWGTTQFGQDLLKAGRVFATADDAADAYNAVSALLRGEE